MVMSGQEWSTTEPDWELIARVLLRLSKVDRATRTRTGLARRAAVSRTTVNKVLAGEEVRDDTLEAFDDAVLVPPGTLKAVGLRDTHRLNALSVPGRLRQVIDAEVTPVTTSPKTRNRQAI